MNDINDIDVAVDQDLDALFDSLISLLEREIEVYRGILDSIAEEKKILLKPSLDKIYESNARKETLILKAKLLEEVRSGIVKKLASALGKSEQDLTLSKLALAADENRARLILEFRDVLSPILKEIRERNENNKLLLDSSLKFVKSSIQFITDLITPSVGYLETGKMNSLSRNGRLLRTEG
jgi:flagellar biosynthesis/type III secretory pathway chaperone